LCVQFNTTEQLSYTTTELQEFTNLLL